uniref:Uncharacterized protein n=1 Tax=Amphora coffeiformis TaxID=265554 RepID=A0A7S3L8Y5_9STRA|mmetsp:Transcript_5010/g.9545  ORF Transcript_5010/g.9545 Transcript_5010/m.9545 type:complete len:464 (+) Transcript_5010:117-1508(+)
MNEDQPPDQDLDERAFFEQDEEQSEVHRADPNEEESEGDNHNNNEAATTTTTATHPGRNPFEALVDWWKGLLPTHHHHPQQRPGNESLAVVTLHYDERAQCAIAVMSQPCPKGVCSVYFTCRVQQGTARRHSALYYELDGFVRDQFHAVQRAVQPHTVHLAVGALESSDAAQLAYLQAQRHQKRLEHHRQPVQEDRFALVLEICRLYRLQDDLDLLSLYCLAQVNRTCRQLASRILRYQRQHLNIRVTPYVDGANSFGYSRLIRRNETNLVEHKESGRTVLYRQCRQVFLRKIHHDNKNGVDACDQYQPVDPAHSFSWACEEIALAHLHQWWGDIAERDYIGQKLVLQWYPLSLDEGTAVMLDTLRLEAGPLLGTRVWQSRKTAVTLHVSQSETRMLDNVTLSYAGQARVVSVHVPWMTLVQAAAKLEWPRLSQSYLSVQQTRPLLPHELEYGELVHDLANAK